VHQRKGPLKSQKVEQTLLLNLGQDRLSMRRSFRLFAAYVLTHLICLLITSEAGRVDDKAGIPKKSNFHQRGKSNQITKMAKDKKVNKGKSKGLKDKASDEVSHEPWLTPLQNSIRQFVLKGPNPGETPYIVIGVRRLIVALFIMIVTLAIVDSFSQVPEIFGDPSTIVVPP
jgi:hypothetical protein